MAQGDARKFFRAFLRRPGSIGALAPSSGHLATRMVEGLCIAPGEHLVEFGPGTGAFTGAIRQLLPNPAAYLGIEIEDTFVDLLRQRFPDLKFVQGSAADAVRLVDEHQMRPVRAIVSGLPFASLPVAAQDGILAGLQDLLEPGCLFRTFQYVHAYVLPNAIRFRRRMAQRFGRHERSRAVLRNLPPAYALTWRR